MQREIHPKGYEICLIDTQGNRHKIIVFKAPLKEEIMLETDRFNHPAWTKLSNTVVKGGQVFKFKNRFKDLDL